MKKNLLGLLVVFFTVVLTLTGCSDEPSSNDIVGNWYGTRKYYNNGNARYQYLTVKFENDKTGSLEYEGPTVYTYAQFGYKTKSGKIICNGVSANSYGEQNTDFTITFKTEGDRIIPVDRYTQFILTRDNSVMTDGDGNEIK